MTTFSQVQERAKLKPRRDPYWSKVSKGCYLGFRKMANGSTGAWSARCLEEASGKQVYKALGEFSELPDHQRHDAAKKAAVAWFDHLGKGGSAQVVTVGDACKNYVDHLRESKGERAVKDAEARFKNYVLNNAKLAGTELAKLTPYLFTPSPP